MVNSISGKSCIVAFVCIASLAPRAANAQIYADSVTGFSNVQGQNGWQYGYYDKTHDSDSTYNANSDFQLMTQYFDDPNNDPFMVGPYWQVANGSYWTSLWAKGGHGNGLVTSGGRQQDEQFAIRRWTSDVAGTVTISGHLSKLDANATSNGIAGYITLDGVQVYAKYISGTDITGVDFTLNANVSVGTKIDFWIDPWQANDLGDSTTFNYKIAAVPAPSSLIALIVGATPGCGLLLRRRRKS